MKNKIFTLLTIVPFALSACSSDDDYRLGTGNGGGNDDELTISTTSSNSFSPDMLIVNVGDQITFIIGPDHTATQVDQATWDANGILPLDEGFNFPAGTYTYTVQAEDEGRTLWYVCQNHVEMGMKGRIVVNGAITYTVTASGMAFLPASVNAKVGDKITFELTGTHTATQVEQSVWEANQTTPKTGGFDFAAGTSTYTILASDVGTLYYVCIPHVSGGMKGTIVVQAD